jgi:hypothetical protein
MVPPRRDFPAVVIGEGAAAGSIGKARQGANLPGFPGGGRAEGWSREDIGSKARFRPGNRYLGGFPGLAERRGAPYIAARSARCAASSARSASTHQDHAALSSRRPQHAAALAAVYSTSLNRPSSSAALLCFTIAQAPRRSRYSDRFIRWMTQTHASSMTIASIYAAGALLKKPCRASQ